MAKAKRAAATNIRAPSLTSALSVSQKMGEMNVTRLKFSLKAQQNTLNYSRARVFFFSCLSEFTAREQEEFRAKDTHTLVHGEAAETNRITLLIAAARRLSCYTRTRALSSSL